MQGYSVSSTACYLAPVVYPRTVHDVPLFAKHRDSHKLSLDVRKV